MLGFNSDESNIFMTQDIGGELSELSSNQSNDGFSTEASVGSTLTSFPESEMLILRGTKDFDSLIGQELNDTLYGFAGNDFLNGKGGDDIIDGGTDRDTLMGEVGNDILIDGDGGDSITGGAGADQFWIYNWDIPETPSTILDFQVGTDTIKIGRLGVTFDSLTFTDDGFSTTIHDREQPIAELIGVEKESLTAESFITGDTSLVNQFQANLEQSVSNLKIPGATQAIVTPEGFTWKGAAGISNFATQTPMHSDNIFSIASITKAFTGATVLKVVESGKISLDDTLGKYLPEIAKNISGGNNITLRQLLNGSSGIPSFNSTEQFATDLKANTFANKSPEEIVSYIYEEPLFSGFQSSSNWSYTNTGHIIAALMLEQATGESFPQLMQDHVIEPLGLDNTFYKTTAENTQNFARSYSSVIDSNLEDITDYEVKNISNFGASAAVFSNAEDVARFTQALFGGELLEQDSLWEVVNFVDTGLPSGNRYGIGVIEEADIASDPWGRKWKLSGNSFGHNSLSLYLPDNGGHTNTVLANAKYAFDNQVQLPSVPILVGSLEAFSDEFISTT